LNQEWSDIIGEFSNPAYWTNYGKLAGNVVNGINSFLQFSNNARTRATEVALRTSPGSNGLQNIKKGLKDTPFRRKLAVGRYILTGKQTGSKGYSRSLYVLDEPTADGSYFYYGGFDKPLTTEKNDLIDAFLYNKEIDPMFGLRRVGRGENDLGMHRSYVEKTYPSKINDIPVYETLPESESIYNTVPYHDQTNVRTTSDVSSDLVIRAPRFTARGVGDVDVGGFRLELGESNNGIPLVRS